MNFTSTNIGNRLLLAKCCLADYAINRLAKLNIGDKKESDCYLNKMKQLYYSMEALHDFVPAAELAPFITKTLSGTLTGTYVYYVDGVQISDSIVFSSTAAATAEVTIANSINTYQNDYYATFSGLTLTLTSVLSGTNNNGKEVSYTVNNSPFVIGDLAGGADQWCLTDTKAMKILDNLDELCGCPCGECDDLLDDTLPRYIN